MTVWEFNHQIMAYSDRQAFQWKNTRLIAAAILTRKGKRVKPQDVVPLPDDKVRERLMPDERVQADIERKLKLFTRLYGNNSQS